jgi:hypothetical protein
MVQISRRNLFGKRSVLIADNALSRCTIQMTADMPTIDTGPRERTGG